MSKDTATIKDGYRGYTRRDMNGKKTRGLEGTEYSRRYAQYRTAANDLQMIARVCAEAMQPNLSSRRRLLLK